MSGIRMESAPCHVERVCRPVRKSNSECVSRNRHDIVKNKGDILLYGVSAVNWDIGMPRTARASQGGFVCQVLNRENGRRDVFHKDDDFAAFVNLMCEAHEDVPMRLTGYYLLSHHFHLILWPHGDGDLSRWMQWLMTSHVLRYDRHDKGSGRVWQGRFNAFSVESDEHYLTVLRDVERNPLRANLVERSQDWECPSLNPTARNAPGNLLSEGPVPQPFPWTHIVNGAGTESELKSLQRSIDRGTPFGDSDWQNKTATQLGLESSLRLWGRRKLKKSNVPWFHIREFSNRSRNKSHFGQ
jgi:putative transposase